MMPANPPTSLDARINALQPGGRVILGEVDGIRVMAERSGDGKMLRFVRQTAAGFVVIKTQGWSVV